MSEIGLERADPDRRPILERLLQFELYEIGLNPGPDGLIDWGESLDDFFADPSAIPYLFTMDGNVVGFALVRLGRRLMGPDDRTPLIANLIEEFYVSRPWRRRGVGTLAIRHITDRHPGPWIATTWPDEGRVAFWRRVTLGREREGARVYEPGEHRGFPGQYVFVVTSAIE